MTKMLLLFGKTFNSASFALFYMGISFFVLIQQIKSLLNRVCSFNNPPLSYVDHNRVLLKALLHTS